MRPSSGCEMNGWMTVPDALRMLPLPRPSRRTLERAIASGALPAIRPTDRRTLVSLDALRDWHDTRARAMDLTARVA